MAPALEELPGGGGTWRGVHRGHMEEDEVPRGQERLRGFCLMAKVAFELGFDGQGSWREGRK